MQFIYFLCLEHHIFQWRLRWSYFLYLFMFLIYKMVCDELNAFIVLFYFNDYSVEDLLPTFTVVCRLIRAIEFLNPVYF